MNRTSPVLAGLLLLFVVQWSVPGYLIHRAQATLGQGAQYRFRTAPIDPVDPFRGRYVRLQFDAAVITYLAGSRVFQAGDRLYAPIRVDADGFAWLEPPQERPPPTGDYLQVTVQWAGSDKLQLRLPFDRYYLDERLAPEAELRYRSASRRFRRTDKGIEDRRRPAYATVRVRNGYAVLEDLFIDDRSVHQLLRATPH